MKNPKPAPVVTVTLCSLCDERWESHGDDPSTLDCIRLLKAKARTQPYIVPIRYPQPYTTPYWTSGYSSSINVASSGSSATITYLTPKDGDEGSAAVA